MSDAMYEDRAGVFWIYVNPGSAQIEVVGGDRVHIHIAPADLPDPPPHIARYEGKKVSVIRGSQPDYDNGGDSDERDLLIFVDGSVIQVAGNGYTSGYEWDSRPLWDALLRAANHIKQQARQ